VNWTTKGLSTCKPSLHSLAPCEQSAHLHTYPQFFPRLTAIRRIASAKNKLARKRYFTYFGYFFSPLLLRSALRPSWRIRWRAILSLASPPTRLRCDLARQKIKNARAFILVFFFTSGSLAPRSELRRWWGASCWRGRYTPSAAGRSCCCTSRRRGGRTTRTSTSGTPSRTRTGGWNVSERLSCVCKDVDSSSSR